jgi:hypothetical protein
MNLEVKKWKMGGFRFRWVYDTGLSEGGENVVFVYYNRPGRKAKVKGGGEGEEEGEGEGEERELLCSRTFYFNEANERRIMNFAEKVARDAEYRRQIINSETGWQKASEIYEEVSYAAFKMWSRLPHFWGYVDGDRAARREYERLGAAFHSLCQTLYRDISSGVDDLWESWKNRKEETLQSLLKRMEPKEARSGIRE